MSDLFTQQSTMPELFKTGEDIAEELKAQTVEPNTATDLLLNGDSKPNRFSRQCAENEEPDADLTENLLHDEKSNKNTITGTNTPRSSRASAYYDLLRSQHKNGHYKAPAYRVVDTIESPLQAGASALNYHDDFDTDAVQNAGLHMAVAQTVVEGNIMAAAADSAFVIDKQAGNILKDLKDETIDAKDALKAGGQVLRLQGGKSVVKIGGATLRSTEQYLSSFQVSTDDFTGSVPGKVKEAATNTGNILKKITKVVLHPLRNLIAMGKVILIGAVILLFLIIVSLLGQMSGTTSTSVFCANRIEDVQTLVQKINDYRNAAVTEGIYQAFQNDVDPNGNPYGYDSLTGQRSNNLQHAISPEMRSQMEWYGVNLNAIRQYICTENRCCILRSAPVVAHIFSELYTAHAVPDTGYLRLKVLELLHVLSRLKSRDDVQQTDYFNQHQVECARRAAKLLTQKLTVHQTIEQLAQDVGLSATALKTCFKGVYGSSVYAYQKEYRLQLAQKLLTETDSTIAEIAHQIGYENPNKFSSAFRQSLGMTPTQYRKRRPIG